MKAIARVLLALVLSTPIAIAAAQPSRPAPVATAVAPAQEPATPQAADAEAFALAARRELESALISLPLAAAYLIDGRLRRVLPEWYVDGGALSLYFPAQRILPAKTRAFIDFVVEHFRQHDLATRLSAV